MTRHERPAIRFHEDLPLFREAVSFTAGRTGFSARLIEKDYFSTVLLAYLAEATQRQVVFKGGTCLAKVLVGFYRLSEDLDFVIPLPIDAPRSQRANHIKKMKAAISQVADHLAGFAETDPLKGANNSTQYNGAVGFTSPLTGQPETILIEVSLREPLLTSVVDGLAGTILLDPITEQPLVPAVSLPCISAVEALSENFRAAMTRREVAIRDYYDLDYASRKLNTDFKDRSLVSLVRQKLAAPGNIPVNLGPKILAELRGQMETRLKPVLRQQDYVQFDLDHSFHIVLEMVKRLAESS